jgi:hypothetical protein
MKIESKGASGYLPESTSILLDIIRFSAAILVLIAHLTHPEFHLGYANMQILGDIAVPVFFSTLNSRDPLNERNKMPGCEGIAPISHSISIGRERPEPQGLLQLHEKLTMLAQTSIN